MKKILVCGAGGFIGTHLVPSHNKLIQEVVGWKPSEDLEKGIDITYKWITEQIAKGDKDARN